MFWRETALVMAPYVESSTPATVRTSAVATTDTDGIYLLHEHCFALPFVDSNKKDICVRRKGGKKQCKDNNLLRTLCKTSTYSWFCAVHSTLLDPYTLPGGRRTIGSRIIGHGEGKQQKQQQKQQQQQTQQKNNPPSEWNDARKMSVWMCSLWFSEKETGARGVERIANIPNVSLLDIFIFIQIFEINSNGFYPRNFTRASIMFCGRNRQTRSLTMGKAPNMVSNCCKKRKEGRSNSVIKREVLYSNHNSN